MNSRDNFLRYLSVAVAVLATFVVFGVSGAQAASTHALVASGSLVAQEHDTSDEDQSDEDQSDEDEATDDPEEDSEDSDDDEDSDNEDSESDEPTEEPTDEPTFAEPSPTDPTDGVTEMPTNDAGTTSEAGASPLGWILLAGGLASAVAAFFMYRRSRGIM